MVDSPIAGIAQKPGLCYNPDITNRGEEAMQRCGWQSNNELMTKYHDTEWGVPVHDDRKLFEFLILDAFQAGVSWSIVLNKRENFRRAFHNFNCKRIAKYDQREVKRLLADAGIIRNRLKIAAAITNAQCFLQVQKEFGSFDKYIWQFVGGRPIVNRWKTLGQIPATSKESDAMSADLKARGFKFVGSTICYAFMQAAGLVNDHTTNCFRYRQVQNSRFAVESKSG
jgi:DNA-3-methyladenine glycosylase I